MSTKILFMLVGLLLVVLVFLGAFLFFFKTSSKAPINTVGTSGFPMASSTYSGSTSVTTSGNVNQLTVQNAQGQSLSVPNFEKAPATMPDPSNAGYYYLEGGVDETKSQAPFQIFYQAPYNYFGITLYKEPLGQYRAQAEQELMQKLGLTEIQMCSLNYDVSAGSGVNDLYSSQNLEFSFCPGAVQLPQ